MPKLWDETIEAHRQAVREATLDATAALVIKHGLAAVTMSRIAKETEIGRATLYKYFPDLQSILHAWLERQVSVHLSQLHEIGAGSGSARDRLQRTLEVFAMGIREHEGGELAALLHGSGHVLQAQKHLSALLGHLIAEAVEDGDVRNDIAPAELAAYCLHALSAAGGLRSRAAVARLITVTMSGLERTADPPVK
ncbi:MAG: TetR/AcrR family transcriptional regulator [Candidatus Dormibacteria bacterium]